jgi:hypothetical protein
VHYLRAPLAGRIFLSANPGLKLWAMICSRFAATSPGLKTDGFFELSEAVSLEKRLLPMACFFVVFAAEGFWVHQVEARIILPFGRYSNFFWALP